MMLDVFLVLLMAAAQEPAPPGRMVEVGGHRVHVYCTGEGSPAVVAVGGLSMDWSLVQPVVARFTRICTYDLAGTAWSEAGPMGTCPDRTAELHALLRTAGIQLPIVLIGFSVGGLVVRYYAGQYPEDVAGMVIIDHAFTPSRALEPRGSGSRGNSDGYSPPLLLEMTPIVLSVEDTTDLTKLPPEAHQLHQWAAARKPGVNQSEAADDCEPRLKDASGQPLGDKPLVVVSTGNETRGYQELQTRLLGLSRRSEQMMALESFHFVAIDQPEVAVAAIRRAVEQVRGASTR